MEEPEEIILSRTESLCPECLERIPARRVARNGNVYLEKRCPDHGEIRTIIWRGLPDYIEWGKERRAPERIEAGTPVERGCPFDCGLCADHLRSSCCVLLDVTDRCDLECPVCFAGSSAGPEYAGAGDMSKGVRDMSEDAGDMSEGVRTGAPRPADPSVSELEKRLRFLLRQAGPVNLQLSGGEPGMRDDLPEIIALAKSIGFRFVQMNTNGLRLAADPRYAGRCAEAGLDCVFLQFDGLDDDVYRRIRGKPLLDRKLGAINTCADTGLGVVLVPTLVPGVNDASIGNLVKFAVKRMPVVRGVHFQPISYFGRYPAPPRDEDRLTIPDILRAIESQTEGMMRAADFHSVPNENPWCSFRGTFTVTENGRVQSWKGEDRNSCCCGKPIPSEPTRRARDFIARQWSAADRHVSLASGTRFVGAAGGVAARSAAAAEDSFDRFLRSVRTRTIAVSGMAFQDVWNIDIERLRECPLHVIAPDSRIVTFCAYNLTSRNGMTLYRNGVGNTGRAEGGGGA